MQADEVPQQKEGDWIARNQRITDGEIECISQEHAVHSDQEA